MWSQGLRSLSPQPHVSLWNKGQDLRVPGYWEIPPVTPFASRGGQEDAGTGVPLGAVGGRTGRTVLGQTRGIFFWMQSTREGLPVAVPLGWEAELLWEPQLVGTPPSTQDSCRGTGQRADFQPAHLQRASDAGYISLQSKGALPGLRPNCVS